MTENNIFKNASKWNKDTSEQYNNKFEYIPIITANIYADLFIIFVN